ncbi:hypothetical protein [Neorhizobium galegae]|uniref:hypothetical protein n=1 Tax=Neorhizobium galegae TaxID=399 RepID=UPI000622A794|nr:hypothetical protein [Neorhizobium galegae]CDZ45604.1 Hypothetical protein NGAL_HAMBI2427_12670 [Neorhizobium galegae bv. orientalis]
MITAKVTTPMSKDDPSDVKIEEIPLPPIEMWGELDNSQGSAVTAPAAPASSEQRVREEEQLDFVDDPSVVIPLKFPFRRQGIVISSITVRRLTIGQVSGLVTRIGGGEISTFDIYSVMTGQPAAVLRGLVSEDGTEVSNVAYGFLPPSLRAGDE